jgi:hypothetical protein
VIVHADLHLHSCLSPDGDLDASPRRIARVARERGLNLLALTDHNSALNAPAFRRACLDEGVTPVFGLEATSREEVHLLCLFARVEEALGMGELLYARLNAFPNDPERFGDQVYIDEAEMILGSPERFLPAAGSLSMEEIAAEAYARNGLFIPAHVDRTATSVYSQLGFLPRGRYSAVEVTTRTPPIELGGLTRTTASDAHYLADIAARSISFEAAEPSFASLRQALSEGAVTLHGLRR